MKYVRTKDGQILRLNEASEKFFEGKKIFLASTHEELKQADAIDELIDGLIVEEKGNPNNWFIMEVDEFKNEEEHLKNWTYRAFIKTKEGLIYAAEMNSEGKLKLL